MEIEKNQLNKEIEAREGIEMEMENISITAVGISKKNVKLTAKKMHWLRYKKKKRLNFATGLNINHKKYI